MKRLALLAMVVLLAACRPTLDDPAATLPVPASLPGFSTEVPVASVAQRASELAGDGAVLLARGDLARAVPVLTEALTVDASHGQARLLLARAFARGGRSSVALRLLEAPAGRLADCGACVDLLQDAMQQADLQHLRSTREGTALFAKVPQAPLPYSRWATELARALASADATAVAAYVDPRVPFELVRTCPACANPAARQENRRTLQGVPLASKLAARFDATAGTPHGTPLRIAGTPACKAGCCAFSASAVPVGEVGLRRLCFRPATPQKAAVTRIDLVYGAPRP